MRRAKSVLGQIWFLPEDKHHRDTMGHPLLGVHHTQINLGLIQLGGRGGTSLITLIMSKEPLQL